MPYAVGKKNLVIRSLAPGILAMLLALLAVGSAYAQNTQTVVTIPFQFRVGDKTLPAGRYTEETDWNRGVLMISDSSGATTYVLVNRAQTSDPSVSTRWVFRRYGDAYFLAEIRTEGDTTLQQIPISRSETALAKKVGGTEVAAIPTD